MSKSDDLPSSEQRLQEMLVACVEALEAGRFIDRAAMLAHYPDLAAELDQFLADHAQLGRMAAPLRQAAEALRDLPTTPESL